MEPDRGAASVFGPVEPSLVSLRVDLVATETFSVSGSSHLSLKSGWWTHGLAMSFISASSQEAADACHPPRSPGRPFESVATSGLLCEGRPALTSLHLRRGDRVHVILSAAGRLTPFALIGGVARSRPVVSVGPTEFEVERVSFESLTAGNPTNLAEIAQASRNRARVIGLEFRSPTGFRRGGDKKLPFALPTPDHIFGGGVDQSDAPGADDSRGAESLTKEIDEGLVARGGLAKTWSKLGGGIPPEFAGYSAQMIGVHRVDVQSACVAVDKAVGNGSGLAKAGRQGRAEGFTGHCSYEAQSEREAASLWALAMLAEFTGVGGRTAVGMGRVRIRV